ncbi:hypothetical protein U27_05166 [Candidatus Vecturithrix granuli]|uniref:ABM domain-containing protein n=1 Tax=Vecturithrix granuli TaxID=1499967 RepID=A0A081C0T8_VECG1|nr:hypothetical protein U27_05166 [Candidatus Vecturithrix granuli]
MNKQIITEVVNFTIMPGITDEDFVQCVYKLEENFHKILPGYIDSELAKGKEGQWTMVMHWESLEQVKQASKLMMQTPSTEDFRQSLDPKSVKIVLLEQKQTWKI